jgi:hypothetical protein
VNGESYRFTNLARWRNNIYLCDMNGDRKKYLMDKRDEALCRRYYYWTETQRLRFDDALKVLSNEEFFISEERIMSIIRRKSSQIKDITVKPVPKIKKPRITARQLSLFDSD